MVRKTFQGYPWRRFKTRSPSPWEETNPNTEEPELSEKSIPIAGGTDFFVQNPLGTEKNIFFLNQLPELKRHWSDENYTYIGAGLNTEDLVTTQVLKPYIPDFEMLALQISSKQIRNLATVGGNIANASILGSFGIVIPFNDKKLALCQRLKRYVKFATAVKKVGPVFQNVLIIKKERFLQLLEART